MSTDVALALQEPVTIKQMASCAHAWAITRATRVSITNVRATRPRTASTAARATSLTVVRPSASARRSLPEVAVTLIPVRWVRGRRSVWDVSVEV